MRQIFFVILLVSIMIGILYALSIVVYPLIGIQQIIRPVITTISEDPTLDRYAIENLKLNTISPSKITFEQTIDETSSYNSYIFSYYVEGNKVTGLAHVPIQAEETPVIVMFRGYVDIEIYETGVGTRNAGKVLAENGYITLAPDFLGYGDSDMPSENPMEERFQRYTTGLVLLDSISSINSALNELNIDTTADVDSVGIWGHSNGGHVSLVMLEVTGKEYPTTLWAPVTKPFPYSILYYTDEFDDHGKALRRLISDFEDNYDVDKYSLTTYMDWIQAPILLHQGGVDDAVPIEWSDDFIDEMEALDKDITYYTYPNDDHNFSKGSWNTVVVRDLKFFKEKFEE